MNPIPIFNGTKPYQEVPFQFSLHYLEDENAKLRHSEFLAHPGVDPRNELIERLLKEIPDGACILVYNKSFEKKILNYLKEWFPEYSKQIDRIYNNIRDLMEPFRNYDVYRWEMYNSYSLKSVLPALLPELSYEKMEINDGAIASNAYLQMWELKDPFEIEGIRKALLEYCKLDILGMVRIVEKLKELLYDNP